MAPFLFLFLTGDIFLAPEKMTIDIAECIDADSD